jgi:K+-transporting ATPase KdpF subunit
VAALMRSRGAWRVPPRPLRRARGAPRRASPRPPGTSEIARLGRVPGRSSRRRIARTRPSVRLTARPSRRHRILQGRSPERDCEMQPATGTGRLAPRGSAWHPRCNRRGAGEPHGPPPRRRHRRLLRRQPRVHPRVRPAVSPAMTFEYAIGIALSVLLAGYLAYALIRPERF